MKLRRPRHSAAPGRANGGGRWWAARVAERTLLLGLVVVMAVSGLIGWLVYESSSNVSHDRKDLERTYQVRIALGEALKSLHEVESGSRRYLIIGNAPGVLDEYNNGVASYPRQIDEIRALIGPGAAEETRRDVDQLALVGERRIASSAENVATYDRDGPASAANSEARGSGDGLMITAEEIVRRLEAAEEAELKQHQAASDDSQRNSVLVAGGLAAATLVLVGGLVFLARRALAQRRLAEQASGQLNAIVNGTDDAVLSVSPDCRVLSWNTGAERLFGRAAPGALHRPLGAMLVRGDDSAPGGSTSRFRCFQCHRPAPKGRPWG